MRIRIALTMGIALAMSSVIALAATPLTDQTSHGSTISALARADYASGADREAAVSAAASAWGAEVAAAAKANATAAAAAGKAHAAAAAAAGKAKGAAAAAA